MTLTKGPIARGNRMWCFKWLRREAYRSAWGNGVFESELDTFRSAAFAKPMIVFELELMVN